MGTTEKKLLQVIDEIEKSDQFDVTYKILEQSMESFEDLIRKGYASRRGYNLQSFEERKISMSYSNLCSLSIR